MSDTAAALGGRPPAPPVLRLAEDGTLDLEWPSPRPAAFSIASDFFEALIGELNAHRRNVARATETLAGIIAQGPAPTSSSSVNGAEVLAAGQ